MKVMNCIQNKCVKTGFPKKKKRPFLLLEVLIAFAIVVLCIFPLITPHVWMIKGEQEFLAEIQADRIVGNLYGELVQDLYENQIPWGQLFDDTRRPFRNETLEKVDLPKQWPYRNEYSIKRIKDKKGKTDGQVYNLFQVTIHLVPLDQRKKLDFAHQIFIEYNPISAKIELTKENE